MIDEPLEDVAPAEDAADPAEEAVIDEPLEDEASAEDPSDQPAEDAPAASEEPAVVRGARRDPDRGSQPGRVVD